MDSLDNLLKIAEKQGTSYADIRFGRIEEKSILAINGEIVKEDNCISSGYGIRTLYEGIITFTSTPHLKYAEESIKKAVKTANLVTSWKKGNSTLTDVPISDSSITRKAKFSWKDLDKTEFKEQIKTLQEHIEENLKVKALIETDVVFLNWSERFTSSEGAKVYQEYPYAILTLTGRVMHNNSLVKYYKNYGGLGGVEVLPFDKPEETENFIEVINNLPTARSIYQGTTKAVLSEDMAWTCLHEVLGHSLEADNVLSGRSFSAGMLGMKLAPSVVSVIDDPYIETVGYYEYDSEGIKGRGTLLVDEGILVDFLHSRETAAAMDSEPTSNYRAFSFEFLPQVRMSNFFFEPKDHSEEELFESVKDGIYIGEGLAGSAEPQTGEYNFDAQYGRKIENGEPTDYILQFQISGKMIETLSKIDSVGDRLLAQPGSCVKNNQRVFVGSVCPKIAVSEMRVS
ncbi:MAG: TldD/PmbA family protein [Candidatus Heimdallarchaeota archaeon]|nr:TldD/PmbA family protein [Candidatus Heimdallarchaeota archaeon]